MITFTELKYKNFLASGANEIKIDLNRSKSTLIVGSNGAGKSTILDALSFGLFGKPHRSVTKNQLINSVNGKGCVVIVKFLAGGHSFKIIRGIKPNIFEIWQNDIMIDQSTSVRDYQKFLEQNILKLTHKSFHQIVVLGSSSFIPFMQLQAHHRREVIEDLLDVSIFGKMKNILKDRSTEVKSSLKKHKGLIDVADGKITYQNKYITKMEGLNKEATADVEEFNKDIDDQISVLSKKGIDLLKEEQTYASNAKEELVEFNKVRDNLMSQMGEAKVAIQQTTEEHLFYMNNDSCPTCEQDITQKLKDERVQTIKGGAKVLLATQQKITAARGINDKEIQKLTDNINKVVLLNKEMSNIQTNIEHLKHNKREPVEAVDLNDDYVLLKKLVTSADEFRDEFLLLSEKILYNDIATTMLKDSGIRTKVVREYLPAMNLLINQYLQTLDFFVSFNLDENFNETIRSRHRDSFVYANFSEGEKQRIDLALLFAWRQVAKMKNSTNTNLLILDETFDSSLDTDGVDNLMKILISLDENTNTFVISHKPDLLESRLKSKIEFKKLNNFSEIV